MSNTIDNITSGYVHTADSAVAPINPMTSTGVVSDINGSEITISDGTGGLYLGDQVTWSDSTAAGNIQFTTNLDGSTCIDVDGKSINLADVLKLLLKAYLPVKISGEKVKMVKVTEMLGV